MRNINAVILMFRYNQCLSLGSKLGLEREFQKQAEDEAFRELLREIGIEITRRNADTRVAASIIECAGLEWMHLQKQMGRFGRRISPFSDLLRRSVAAEFPFLRESADLADLAD